MQKQSNHHSIFVHIHHILNLNWHWGLQLLFLIHNWPSEDIIVTPLILIFSSEPLSADKYFKANSGHREGSYFFQFRFRLSGMDFKADQGGPETFMPWGMIPASSEDEEQLASKHINWIKAS